MALFLVSSYLEWGEFHCIWNGRWNLISDITWNWKLIAHHHKRKQSMLWTCIKHYSSPFNLLMWDNFLFNTTSYWGWIVITRWWMQNCKVRRSKVRHEASLEKELTLPARDAVDQHFKFGTQGEMWNWMLCMAENYAWHTNQYSYTIYMNIPVK